MELNFMIHISILMALRNQTQVVATRAKLEDSSSHFNSQPIVLCFK